MNVLKTLVLGTAACLTIVAGLLGVGVSPARATVILEGSDAIGYHCTQEAQAGACTYRDEVWTAIGASDPRPIAVIGDVPGIGSTTHAVQDFTSVAAAGSLSNYVALYFVAGGGCCAENDALVTAPGAQSAISAYLAAGGTVMIENYTGGSAWDFAVGTSGGANSAVAGYAGGYPSSLTCSDGESVTALGTTNGFLQPPAISCWTHQAYNEAVFAPLGFTNSFFNAPDGYGYPAATFSSLLSNGSTVTVTGPPSTTVPEPASLAVLSIGLAGLAAMRRRRG